MAPRQYDAANVGNVPRSYNFTGEDSTGASGINPGFTSFTGGIPVPGAKFSPVTDGSYPNTDGSYVNGDGNNWPRGSGVIFAVAEGERVDVVHIPGYNDNTALNPSGIVHTRYSNPSTLNIDPYLSGDV